MNFSDIQAIVTDIEGTTSSISFVHDVLFPYARKHIPDYVRQHATELKNILSDIATECGKSSLTSHEAVQVLLGWMDEDRKITPLKALQGLIWAAGYDEGAFKGHVFAEVPGKLKQWAESGISLYIYSSGSIGAQKQIFGFSDAGDLTPYFKGYFDTTTGGKTEAASYIKIANTIGFPCSKILFLSDHPEELQAARVAGYRILGLNRPGNAFDLGDLPTARSFDDIVLEQQHDSAA